MTWVATEPEPVKLDPDWVTLSVIEPERIGHRIALHLMLSNQRSVARNASLVAFVGKHVIARTNFCAAVRREAAAEGATKGSSGVSGHFAQIDNAGLA